MTKFSGFSEKRIAIIVIFVFIGLLGIIYYSQYLVDQNALTAVSESNISSLKEQREIDKLAAEVRQIRSDTAGSLFWLKIIALFVTVGGAVGGYLVGQSRMNRERIDFENRKEVDSIYQSLIQELADKESPILRAAASVKLGKILQSFPPEWENHLDKDHHRRDRIIELTKRVLAASLSIESDATVLKTSTIAIIQHRPWEENLFIWENIPGNDNERLIDYLKKMYGFDWLENAKIEKIHNNKIIKIYREKGEKKSISLELSDDKSEVTLKINDCEKDKFSVKKENHKLEILGNKELREMGDLRGINLSNAKADDAYWAKVDFSNADFYKAELNKASFKKAILFGAQFRESRMNEAVLKESNCSKANFKLAELKGADFRGADLRGADFTGAKLIKTKFEGAKVHGSISKDSEFGDDENSQVDISPAADGSNHITVKEWLKMQGSKH